MSVGPTKLLILQSTSFCNLDCSYCYLPNRSQKSFMPADVAKKAIDRLFDDGLVQDNISLVWHAGEPLVVPREFYLEIDDYIKKYSGSATIRHHFQTNGVLIDDDWCELFKKIGARVGVSIDGPREIHDECRTYRNDKGSFDQAYSGLKLIQKHGIEHHIISVIRQKSLERSGDVLSFFRDLNAQSVGFNIEEVEGINDISTLSNECRESFGEFFAQIINLHKTGQMRSREIHSLEEFFKRRAKVSNNDQNVPLRIITVDSKGDFSTFSPELHGMTVDSDPFVFGNVNRDSYLDIFGNAKFLGVYEKILAGNELCKKSCKYFAACGGGAPSNKFYENGSFSTDETVYCRLKIKEVIDQFTKHESDSVGGLNEIRHRETAAR